MIHWVLFVGDEPGSPMREIYRMTWLCKVIYKARVSMGERVIIDGDDGSVSWLSPDVEVIGEGRN